MNYVIPGTNVSFDLIAVAFLIWDSVSWALQTQQYLSVTSAAATEL